tara:strand:+ start:4256 stop:4444 length:189 start_codon:yes stop_codon:yes gene_type:complete
MTWLDGGQVHEAELLIVSASLVDYGSSIDYKVKLESGSAPNDGLIGVCFFVDSGNGSPTNMS